MLISDLNRAIKYRIVTASITRYIGTISKNSIKSISGKVSEKIIENIFGIMTENILESVSGYFYIFTNDSNETFTVCNSALLDHSCTHSCWKIEDFTNYTIHQENNVYTIDVLKSCEDLDILEIIKFQLDANN